MLNVGVKTPTSASTSTSPANGSRKWHKATPQQHLLPPMSANSFGFLLLLQMLRRRCLRHFLVVPVLVWTWFILNSHPSKQAAGIHPEQLEELKEPGLAVGSGFPLFTSQHWQTAFFFVFHSHLLRK